MLKSVVRIELLQDFAQPPPLLGIKVMGIIATGGFRTGPI